MPISGTPTPSFSRPPLVEVALGVEFSPVSGFGAVALVKLADRLHGRYPIVQEYSPLPPNPPIGLDDQIGGGLVVSMGAPSIRLWLLSQEQDQLLQVQRDRLILNWRAGTINNSYPRYHDALRPAFAREYRGLLSFLMDAGRPTLSLVGVEVTYVNVLSRFRRRIPRHWRNSPFTATVRRSFRRPANDAPATTMGMDRSRRSCIHPQSGCSAADQPRVRDWNDAPAAAPR